MARPEVCQNLMLTGQSFENDDLLLAVFAVNATFDAFTGAATSAG
jgi:hypothetical protein